MRILVSGICGTWGKEFVRLLKDNQIIGYDNNEQAVAQFKHEFPEVEIRLANYGTWDYSKDPVDIIIHLAAYKHIDICEDNAMSCVKNNIVETYQLFQEAKKNNVKILFISTDKAVEPVSTYGMSKAIGERMAWDCNGQVARSGNIIGSNGSVFQIWNNLIKEKKSLKITNPDMLRYFIKVDYAVSESWKGFLDGKRLNIIKGDERKLSDFLGDILESNGYDRDFNKYPYGIEIVGNRPGEKLREKLEWDTEVEE